MYICVYTQAVPTMIVSLEKQHWDTVGREVDNVVLVKLDTQAAATCCACIMAFILHITMETVTAAGLQPRSFWTSFRNLHRCRTVNDP